MPPHDCMEPMQIFIRSSDDEYIPFNLEDCTEIADVPKLYDVSPLWTETGEMYFSLTCKATKQAKQFQKMIKRELNKHNRQIRTMKRLREKARRRICKNA